MFQVLCIVQLYGLCQTINLRLLPLFMEALKYNNSNSPVWIHNVQSKKWLTGDVFYIVVLGILGSQEQNLICILIIDVLTIVRMCKTHFAQVNVMGCSSVKRCFYWTASRPAVCHLLPKKSGSPPNQSKQAPDGGFWTHNGVHSMNVYKGGILFHRVRACLWICAHQMCMVYSSGLTHQTICLVSVSSSDFKTM